MFRLKQQGFLVFFTISLNLATLGSALEVFQQRIVVNASELCILPITPALFKWEKQSGYINQIEYTARIANSPDLPGWLQYTYDGFNSVGYLYGVPPVHLISVNLDVIGWNKYEGYDVRKLIISLEIMRKDPMRYVIEIKIDNMNVKEMSIPRRMSDLVNVLSDQLSWVKNDGNKVVPVFMASAVALGENRVPVRPNEAEGVVVHFASDLDFSPELKKLQVEVLPLWKLRPCPRDMKRTSVERHFRKFNLLVDWCSFRLTIQSESGGASSEQQGNNKDKDQSHGQNKDRHNEGEDVGGRAFKLPAEPEVFHFRSEIPERAYGFEILLSTIIPGSIGGLVGFLLIVLLRTDRDEEAAIDEDTLFFEAAFRMFFSMIRFKQGNANGSQYIYHQPPQQEAGVIVMTRDNGHGHSLSQEPTDERELLSTPVPPQYGETHPNGAPALIYAV